jgi:c-di-GMP-binding flagellar brake protein YcgR
MSNPTILRQDAKSTDFFEKRKNARLDLAIKTICHVGESTKGVLALTRDISVGGCLLSTDQKLPKEGLFDLEIYLSTEDKIPIRARGSVVRSQKRDAGLIEYGICFEDIGDEQRLKFVNFCFGQMYERTGLTHWTTSQKTNEKE